MSRYILVAVALTAAVVAPLLLVGRIDALNEGVTAMRRTIAANDAAIDGLVEIVSKHGYRIAVLERADKEVRE